MNGLVEIFRTGKHTDSKGRKKEFTTADLDRIVASYDPSKHEAPAVIGHPKDNGPAYGWVEKLKRSGEILLATFKQVEPQFAEMVSSGRFKKRSISLYPDGRLRHVGFLGATPPAVRGLKDITFSEEDDFEEYQQPITEEVDMTEVEKLQKQLEEEQALRKTAEGQVTEFKQKVETSTANFNELQTTARKKAVTDFIEAGIKDGKLLPVWKEKGLGNFMLALDEAGGEYEFCEGKKQAPATFFREFLESFSKHPLFKEMVKPADEKAGEDAEFEEDMQAADDMAAYVNSATDE